MLTPGEPKEEGIDKALDNHATCGVFIGPCGIGPWHNEDMFGSIDRRFCFFFSSRRRHTRLQGDWSSDVCSSDLGVAPSLDGALLNNATTMAVNATVADGGSLTLFASDYNGGMGFATGRTLTVTATFSDGSSAQAVTTVTNTAVTVSAVTPSQGTMGTTEAVAIDGGCFVSGAMVSAGAGITVSNVVFVSSARLTASFAIASGAMSGPRDVTVTNPGSGGGALTNGFTVTLPAAVTLAYNGKLRDKVGGGDTFLGGDGAADATMTLTLSAAGGRNLAGRQLFEGNGGAWGTTAPNAAWGLGVAPSLGGGLLDNATTMA